MTDRTCSTDDCCEPTKALGFCKRHYAADHYRRNREAYRANSIRYREEHLAALKEQRKARYHSARDAAREATRQWRIRNREKSHAASRAHYRRNPIRYKELSRQWRQVNRERFLLLRREGEGRRRARRAGGIVSRADLAAILVKHGMVCHICSETVPSLHDLHFDHVIPLARGGAHHADNLAPAHARCNLAKGARILDR